MPFGGIGIVGLGVMGGSLLLALRALDAGLRIYCSARSESARRWAGENGGTRTFESPAQFPEDLDLVILTIPARAFVDTVPVLLPRLSDNTLVTDVASSKRECIPCLSGLLGHRPYLSSHPMTGSEKTGVDGARADLYAGRKLVLTPHSPQSEKHLPRLQQFWESLGMQVIRMCPEEHDAAVAWVSHMPHLAIAALVRAVEKNAGGNLHPYRMAGTGMRDIARLAASNPELWCDIIAENIGPVASALDGLIDELAGTRDLLKNGHRADIRRYFEGAKEIHQRHRLGK